MLMDTSVTSPFAGSQVGRSVPRLEGRGKVTGRAKYTHTMRLPGMLYAKLFRGTVPNGCIKSVDVRQVDGMSADLFPELYTAWHLSTAARISNQVTLSKLDSVEF
jgi:hypothetical protein